MYNKGDKNVAVKPSVDPKKIDRRRDEALKLYQEKARSLTEEVRILEGKKNALETTLKSSYTGHQAQVDALYDALKVEKSTYEAVCNKRELDIIEKQRRVDTEQANLETQRITISDSKLDLIDKENRLIEFGNDLNAQQQIIDNDKDYVQSMEETNRVARVELDLLKDESNESIKRSQERKSQILKMEADLNARIAEHDKRLDQIQEESKKLEAVTRAYKGAQSNTLISEAERREFDAEVEKNRQYAVKLKETATETADEKQKVAVERKAAHALTADLNKRLNNVKILERKFVGEQK